MITAIEIENFKGIGERVRIPLKPITLLFGPNSSGKSTVLHALHYIQEVLGRHNLDAGHTMLGGTFVDLGGFSTFVHNRNPRRSVVIRIEFAMCDAHWPLYFDLGGELDSYEDERFARVIETAYVEVSIAWSDSTARPFCAAYEVGINGTRFGTIRFEPGRSGANLDINPKHPIWAHIPYRTTHAKPMTDKLLDITYTGEDWSDSTPVEAEKLLALLSPSIHTERDALPTWGERLPCGFSSDLGSLRIDHDLCVDVSRLMVRPGEIARDELSRCRYVGPLREKPARNYEPPRYPDTSRWASGLGAWDALQCGDIDLLQEVSEWLARPDRLATGYLMQRLEYREFPIGDPRLTALVAGRAFDEADLEDVGSALRELPICRRLVLLGQGSKNRLLPHDVGEGISQILPVVVAILDDPSKVAMIEQPELHVHPSVQVGIGDLLIEGTRRRKAPMLIETHSEHLLLRLLRRIRETAESDAEVGEFRLSADDLAVVYMEQADGEIRATPLRIDQTGEFIDRWPKGFFEERAKELF